MKKGRWLLISVLAALLAVGLTAGAALADGDGTEGDTPWSSFSSRVAAILGLDEGQVQDAMDQAAGELRDEMHEQRLDYLVEQGRLTEEQAAEYRDWYESRPEGVPPGLGFRGHRGHGSFGGHMSGGRGWHGMGFFNGAPGGPAPESVEPGVSY